ncbi:hypothetical protein BDF21DRAFT_425352 [Thamnidium elegans]|uniref:Uncharacterized protein n=1 Tax=Thamnidium elegans TaxID=101142 RepID=A0A8H7VYW6_9FUNG|nr:hypothetical protein INT48_000904 [Thamnidium elegans]KAI8070264.1 hypothetical protein BDF21DRAFT_425352 [Thamnidium elegans]
MNSRTFLAIFAIVCFIALANAQSSADPIASLQDKASAVASSATNTAAPSPTGESAGNMLTSGSVFMQLVVLTCAFVASSYLV